MELTQQNKTDLLEVVIVLAMFFLIVVIYVPVAIWEEEDFYEKESRYRMQNVYDIESFYSRLTGEYNPNFIEAMSVVNAARDSTVADSLFIGEQYVKLYGKEFFVDVDESFGFEYDTTFGIKSFRKDTVQDTTVQIAVFSEDLGRNDTSFIRKKDLQGYIDSENFIGVVKEEPLERVEAVEYYKTFIPDSTTNFCPLTNNQYVMEISEDGTDLVVSSPITDPIIESHYLIFSFRAANHGVIRGGRKSWE
ncbi:MAG: hypothetical protein QF780_01210 [Candidatus Marinimicrobia bacterium]|mgnify:CR=1 FL=1|jgi:hypothetical protein|nr:hypothetical protein [Candidatus Neomarinimicrobiota bacterium]|tara:strand:- start:1848 stop:2594 length:747 start_codon:yes stop_codon:yes gene_type:complete